MIQSATAAFGDYVLGLLEVFERLPIPIAIAFDPECTRIESNRALRLLAGATMPRFRFLDDERDIEVAELPLQRAAREGVDVVDFGMQLVRNEDGARFDLMASAWPLRDSEGRIAGSVAVCVDITAWRAAQAEAARTREALALSEQRYRLITEAIPQFVWLDGTDGSALYANQRWLDYTGLTPEENVGWGWQRVVHPEDARRLASERERTLRSGQGFEGECRYRGKDGKYRWFLFRSIPVRDEHGVITTWLGTATDIDKQKRAGHQQTFFALASDVLGSTLDVGTTLERIARLAVDELGTWCQIDMPDARGQLRVAVVAHQDPAKEELLARMIDRAIYADDLRDGPPAVLATRKPQLVERVNEQTVERVVPDARLRKIYNEVGYRSGVIVPMRVGDRVVGTLMIASDDPTRLYTDVDVSTALELARRGAIALENAQIFAREHRVASTLQRALLPAHLPHNSRVAFHAAYAAAASADGEAVGGDWYDAFVLPNGHFAVSMGDVAGHGIEAAVTMSIVRQAIRAAALERQGPAEVLTRADAVLALDQRYPMITALFAIYDLDASQLSYAIAGHPRPLMADDARSVIELSGSGPPLGAAFDPQQLSSHSVAVPKSATLVFYTDGLLEYDRNVERAEARIHEAVRAGTFTSAKNPAQALIDAVLDAPQVDDIAVLVLEIKS